MKDEQTHGMHCIKHTIVQVLKGKTGHQMLMKLKTDELRFSSFDAKCSMEQSMGF